MAKGAAGSVTDKDSVVKDVQLKAKSKQTQGFAKGCAKAKASAKAKTIAKAKAKMGAKAKAASSKVDPAEMTLEEKMEMFRLKAFFVLFTWSFLGCIN